MMLKKFTSISEIQIQDHFPSRKEFSKEALVLFDSRLKKYGFFKKWLQSFDKTLALNAGESLKSIESFSRHIKDINSLTRPFSKSKLEIIAVGGGSVGDFSGFLASILKRGVSHIQIPTTWLAAIDSAHGGKNGLNIGGAKNQIGTFYPAKKIYIVKEILWPQANTRALEALSELIKIGFIKGGRWTVFLKKQLPRVLATPIRIFTKGKMEIRLRDEAIKQLLWDNIPHAVKAKGSIVRKDPFEKLGPRRVLNLGHTLGHVLEAYYGWPHGVAIAEGLRFAVEWSHQRGYLNSQIAGEFLLDILSVLPRGELGSQRPIHRNTFLKILLFDKKSTERKKIAFIFVRGFGKPYIKEVSAFEIVKEAERQGWIQK
jgi:3-dehydroquinate synthase